MHLENIAVGQLYTVKKDDIAGATIIDFKASISKEETGQTKETIDGYCSSNFIIPALIKFKLERNELNILKGGREILQKYKPQILIECAEGTVSRETLITVFTFLSGLHYSGYFILDTLKVPLANFDFDTYQSEVSAFIATTSFLSKVALPYSTCSSSLLVKISFLFIAQSRLYFSIFTSVLVGVKIGL